MGILEDDAFKREIYRLIEDELISAEDAVRKAVQIWEKRFLDSNNYQLMEKRADILDVGKRILANLCIEGAACSYRTELPYYSIGKDVVLVTKILLPSLMTLIDKSKIVGIVSELGNKASHSAVLAKSIGLPAVFGVEKATENIVNGDELIVDGSSGIVFVNPDKNLKNEYETIRKKYFSYRKRIEKLVDKPSITKDGVEIELYANVGAYADVETALKNNACGVGLYRTEMPFLIRNEFPSEDLQFRVYKRVVERMNGKTVGIRTLDLGGDKILSYFSFPKEENPNLGWRAIRVFLDHPDLFKSQLRAILRASVYGNVKIIIPMVSDLSEVYLTKKYISEAKEELKKMGYEYSDNIPVGIMVEVPSAAILADEFIKEVDFFSIGTNDLIQYTLAVDRNSEKVAKYFEPLSPAILRMLDNLIKVSKKNGKEITICGEIAGDPMYVPLLIGFGYTKLSVNPSAINVIKDIVMHISYKSAKKLAEESLKMRTAEDVKKLLINYASEYNRVFRFYVCPIDKNKKAMK